MHVIQRIRPISAVIDLNAILYNRRSSTRKGATDEHPTVRLRPGHGFPADARIPQMRPALQRVGGSKKDTKKGNRGVGRDKAEVLKRSWVFSSLIS